MSGAANISETGPPGRRFGASKGDWYLSFDCATKSFAFCLLRVGSLSDEARVCADRMRAAIADRDACGARAEALELDTYVRGCLYLAGGGATDLVPGVKDFDISTVERIRALSAYLKNQVKPTVDRAAADGCPAWGEGKLNVAIEFQMGPNARARAIAHCLVGMFVDENVFLVGPALKNKLRFASRPDLRYCMFVERYRTLYTANKNHSLAIYEYLAELFNFRDPDVPRKFRKDFADSVAQILGFLAYGDVENAAKMF